MKITAGAAYRLTTGKVVKVTAVTEHAAYITRPDGSYPRAVALAWLTSKIAKVQS